MPSRFRELLPQAVGEVEQKWASGAIAAREARAFCRRLLDRMNYGDQPYWDRMQKLVAQIDESALCIEDDVVELESEWSEHAFDNYKDIIEACDQLLGRTEALPLLRKRVAVVLGGVIGEIEELDDPIVSNYLGEWGTRAHWAGVLS